MSSVGGLGLQSTRVGWKVHRLTMMQWSNLTKCGLYVNIVSPVVHTLLPSVLQRLDSCGIKIVLNCRYDLIVGPIIASQLSAFSSWGTENSQMVPNQENMEGDQPSSKPQSRTATIATTDMCAGALSWWNRTPFISFPGRSRNVSTHLYYFSKSWVTYIQCGLIWKEIMQLVDQEMLNLMHAEFYCCGTTP